MKRIVATVLLLVITTSFLVLVPAQASSAIVDIFGDSFKKTFTDRLGAPSISKEQTSIPGSVFIVYNIELTILTLWYKNTMIMWSGTPTEIGVLALASRKIVEELGQEDNIFVISDVQLKQLADYATGI